MARKTAAAVASPVAAPVTAAPVASIPAPRTSGTPMVSAASLLASFAKKAPPATKAKQRAKLDLSPEAQDLFKVWVPAKVIATVFAEHLENAQAALDEQLRKLYCKAMWNAKSQPENPKLSVNGAKGVPDMEAMLVVVERFTINAPDCSDGSDPKESFVTLLVSIGMQEAQARRLVEDELFFEPTVSINLTALFYGAKVGSTWQAPTSIQQSAATKVLNYLAGNADALTPDEQNTLVTTTTTKVVFKNSGFLERAASYCAAEDVLYKMLTVVFKPVYQHRSPKFGVNDDLATRNGRLAQEAVSILAANLGLDTDNGD